MGIIAFGTLWFWIAFVVASGLIIFFLESALEELNEDDGGGWKSTLTIIGFVGLYWWLGDSADLLSILQYIKTNTVGFLTWIGVYILIGLVWSVVKWYFFLLNARDKAVERQKDGRILENYELPTAAKNKARIITWMSYFPFSMLWTVINEPFKRLYNFLYGRFVSVFERLEKYVLGELRAKNEELKKIEQDKRNSALNRR
jgi:hypothetical protein